MFRSSCPSLQELAGFRSGSLIFDRHLAVSRHIKTCPACKATVACMPTVAEDATRVDKALASPMSLPVDMDLTGKQIGPYRLGRPLGRGGMGIVYEGVHEKLEQVAAIKILSQAVPTDSEAHARFRREWSAIGRLDHPNVVRALHADECDGVAFLAMERIVGTDLVLLLRRQPRISPADAAAIIRLTALGLAHAHSHGVIHRDVKPSNIFLNESGQVKLLDLGLAQITDVVGHPGNRLAGKTHLGTSDYMSPEQWDNPVAADQRSDIYSLGCVFYFLLTGQAPYSGSGYATPLQKMQGHKQHPTPDPARIDPTIPAEVVKILHCMMNKDPAQRPQSAELLAEALGPLVVAARLDRLAKAAQIDTASSFADGQDTHVAPLALPTRNRSWILGLIAILILVLGILSVLWI